MIISLGKARNGMDNDHLIDVLAKKRERNSEIKEDKDEKTKKSKQDHQDREFVRMTEQEYMACEREMHRMIVMKNVDFKRTGLIINDEKYQVSVSIDGTITGEELLRNDFKCEKVIVDSNAEYPVKIVNCSVEMKVSDGSASMKKNGGTVGFSEAQLYIATQKMGVLFGILIDKHQNLIPVLFDDRIFISHVIKNIKWAHEVEEFGHTMEHDPPSRLELYPNMRHVSLDAELQNEKYELAKKNHELTLMADVSVEKRNEMKLNYGVDRMDDPNLKVEALIPTKGTKCRTVGALIDANKREKDPTPIQYITEYKEGDAGLDFETLKHGYEGWKIAFLFMIGFAYKNDSCFEGIRVTKITKEEQLRIVNYFLKRVEELKIRRVIHWGHHEKTIFKRLEEYYDIEILNHFEMVDLCVITKKIPWAPKGAFTYSVKSFGKALYASGLIDTTWTTECTDGSDAAFLAGVAYLQDDTEKLNDIQEYNRIDVIAMMQVYNYMRSVGILQF